jgi:hypothetical protein
VTSNGCGTSSGDACMRYDGCRDGADVEYCEGDFAHRWPPEATVRIWDFFKRHPMPVEIEIKGSRDREIK